MLLTYLIKCIEHIIALYLGLIEYYSFPHHYEMFLVPAAVRLKNTERLIVWASKNKQKKTYYTINSGKCSGLGTFPVNKSKKPFIWVYNIETLSLVEGAPFKTCYSNSNSSSDNNNKPPKPPKKIQINQKLNNNYNNNFSFWN